MEWEREKTRSILLTQVLKRKKKKKGKQGGKKTLDQFKIRSLLPLNPTHGAAELEAAVAQSHFAFQKLFFGWQPQQVVDFRMTAWSLH